MNILIRKLIFNEADIHLILWNNKPCFFVSELSKALDSVNKEDISVFLRYGGSAAKGIDFDVVAGAEAKDLRKQLENSCIKKKFAHTMIIYFDGLRKYFNHRKTVESKDFTNYLLKCKVSLESDTFDSVGTEEIVATIEATAPTPMPPTPSISEDIVDKKTIVNKKSTVKKKPVSNNKPTVSNIPEIKNDPTDSNKPFVSSKNKIASNINSNSSNYSDFLKHISFMEEFVDTFNKANITADKSVAFTKSMAKFFEGNGIQINDFLKELKKWIV
jgi:hypothetical protein